MRNNEKRQSSRRTFLGALASGTAAFSMATIATPLSAGANAITEHHETNTEDPEAWLKQIKGKHRVVFDVTQPHDIFPFVWPRVFLMTNEETGTPEKDSSTVVVLRHTAIPYAMQNHLWPKYNFGEVFQVDDKTTKAKAVRNPFWQPQKGDYKVPGVGDVAIGINELQQSGVMFCVCNMALTVYSAAVAANMNMKPEDVKKEWVSGLLPGIQIVPSGLWALTRAQERGCAYVFAS